MLAQADLLADLSVQVVNPTQVKGWERLIGAFPASVFFHTADWAAVLHATYNHQPFYMVASPPLGDPGPSGDGKPRVLNPATRLPVPGPDSDKPSSQPPTAILPLMEVISPVTGRRGVCLPFSDFCPPLVTDQAQFTPIFDAALALGRERRWRYLEVRGVQELGAVQEFVGHRLELDSTEGDLVSTFRPWMRRAVRRAMREGVECQIGATDEATRAFYHLHCLTRRRHGLPPPSHQLFQNIHDLVLSKGHGFVVLARRKGVPVAGAVFLRCESTAIFKYGASDGSSPHASHLAMAKGIQRLAQDGVRTLEFGRTSSEQDGLRRFKLGFGAQEYPIHYVRFDLKKEEFARARGLMKGWLPLRHLPVPVLQLAGRLIYRHLS